MNTRAGQLQNPTLQAIYERRSVRKYKEDQVDMTLIKALISAGRMAPSAMNHQPWHFYVLSDREKIARISHAITSESKLKMLRAGIKDAMHHVFKPGNFHLKESLDFFRDADPVFHGAPVVIFITSEVDNDWARLDTGMCAQNIMLAAKSLGLDTCPVGLAKFVEHTSQYEHLHIPSTEKIELAIVVGYGNEHPPVHERKQDNLILLDKI